MRVKSTKLFILLFIVSMPALSAEDKPEVFRYEYSATIQNGKHLEYSERFIKQGDATQKIQGLVRTLNEKTPQIKQLNSILLGKINADTGDVNYTIEVK